VTASPYASQLFGGAPETQQPMGVQQNISGSGSQPNPYENILNYSQGQQPPIN